VAYDLRQGTGQTKWPAGIVFLLGAAGIVVAVLVIRNRSAELGQDAAAASATPPAGVATFSTRPAPVAPGRSATAAGKSGGSAASNASPAIAAPPVPAPLLGPDGKPLPTPVNASAVASTPTATPAMNARVYDATSKDVTPAVLVTPLVYSPLPTGVRKESLAGAIQVRITQSGSVDTVKYTLVPKSVGEAGFITWALSIAKTWHYEPAMKDGQPVRYQVLVPISVFIR
jgi:hypothetical protein